jgi:ABC-2 type transport system permease protein
MNSSAVALRPTRSQSHGSATRALAGTIRYEFLMQLRRKALWVVFLLIGAFLTYGLNGSTLSLLGPQHGPYGTVVFTQRDVVLFWTEGCWLILVLGAGLLLADRIPRDRRTRVNELLLTAPAPTAVRIAGKYLGAAGATLVPIFLIYAIGIARMVLLWHNPGLVVFALVSFAALIVPPTLFVGAFSIACTTVLWAPLYQFLFVGYWFWTTLNPAGPIPTLSGTLLAPVETYVYGGLFHFTAWNDGFLHIVPAWLGIANIAALLGAGALALVAGWVFQSWRANYE